MNMLMDDWNRVLVLRRLRWPALLLLTGVIALLDQMHILTWDHAWPLYLILLGVMGLAERAALASVPPPDYPMPGYPASGYPASGYPPAGYPGAPAPNASASTASASTTPAWTQQSEQVGIVPVSPFTSLASTSIEPRQGDADDFGKEHRS